MNIKQATIEIETGEGFETYDITSEVRRVVAEAGVQNGFVTVTSRHTTTALGVNEYEVRLLDDIRAFFAHLTPPGAGPVPVGDVF